MDTPNDDGTPDRPLSRREAREARRDDAASRPAAPASDAAASHVPADGLESEPSASEQVRQAYDAMITRGGTPLPTPASDHEFSGGLLQAFDEGRGIPRRRDQEDPVAPKPERRRRRVWPWIVVSILVLIIAIAIPAVIFVREAMAVRDDLTAAKGKIASAMDAAKAGDLSGLDAISADVLTLTTRADATVDGPLWDIASAVPFVGANVTAVSEATRATHILVTDALPAGMELLSKIDLKNLKLEGGGFNLQPLRDAQGTLPVLTAAFGKAMVHIDKIDRDAILPFVDDNVGQLIDIVEDAGPVLDAAEKYLPVLLPMAGDGAPRSYIVLFQNNAEIRATGGNAATSALLSVDDGRIEMVEDRRTDRFHLAGVAGWNEASLDESRRALYESDTADNAQNYSRTPDFPETARLFDALWTQVTGEQIDGVISIDPVVLQMMLKVTGPIETTDGEINGDNAVQQLLSESYERYGTDGLASDAYFASVASNVFEKVSAGDWDVMAMFDTIQQAVDQQRVYMWLRNEAEQAMAVEFDVDGALTSDNSRVTQTGVYLNNASYSKLEYYLSTSVAVSCDPTARTLTTAITMHNSIPGSNLSGYTLGYRNERLGYPRTTILLDVLSYALPGGSLVGVDPAKGDSGGGEARDRSGVENGREAKSLFIALPMGETRTVSFTSTIPDDATTPLEVRFSPTVTDTPVTVDGSCSALFPVPAP